MARGPFADARSTNRVVISSRHGALVQVQADPLACPWIDTDCKGGKVELPAEFPGGGRSLAVEAVGLWRRRRELLFHGSSGSCVCRVPAGRNLYHVDHSSDLQQAFLAHQGVSQGVGKRMFLSDSSLSTYDKNIRFRISCGGWKRIRPPETMGRRPAWRERNLSSLARRSGRACIMNTGHRPS